jgi:hypothetical protein
MSYKSPINAIIIPTSVSLHYHVQIDCGIYTGRYIVYNVYGRFFSQGIKKPEHETYYPLAYSDEVINSAPSVHIRVTVF